MKLKGYDTGFFKNLKGHGLEKGVRLFLNLLVAAMMARTLGPSGWGDFNFLLVSASFVVCLLPSGLDGFFAVEIRTGRLSLTQVLKAKLTLLFPNLILFLFYFFWSESPASLRSVTLIFAFHWIFLNLDISDLYFQAYNQTPTSNINRTLAAAFGTAVKLFLLYVYRERALLPLAVAQICETLLLQALQIKSLRGRLVVHAMGSFRAPILRHHWLSMGPIWLISLCVFIYGRSDQVILRTFSNSIDSGIYSTSLRLYEYALTIPMILGSALFPVLVGTFEFSNQLKNTVRISLVSILLCTFALIAFSRPLILGIFGNKYESSIVCIRILFLALPLVAMSTMRQAWLNSRQKFWEAAAFEGFCLVLVISFQILLVKFCTKLSVTPATAICLAILGASIISNLLAHLFLPHFREFHLQICGSNRRARATSQ